MWTPVSLVINNLFSHQQSEFNFNNNKTTIISGINKTDQNVKSNGSGKTSILDCITIALIGEPLRNINKKEIVRNGESFGLVQLTLINSINLKKIEIYREIHVSKSNKAQLTVDGVIDASLKDLSPSDTDKHILKLLGISKDDLCNYFLISKDSYQSFFLSGDVAKKEIINRFSKANTIDHIDPFIKDDITLFEKEIASIKPQIDANNGVLNHLSEEIDKEKLESSIEKSRQLIIKSLEDKRDIAMKLCDELPDQIEAKEVETTLFYESEIIPQEDKIKITKDLIEAVNANITTLDNDRLIKIREKGDIEGKYRGELLEYANKTRDIIGETRIHESDMHRMASRMDKIDAILKDSITCPKCNHSFSLNDDEAKLKEEKEENIAEIDKINTKIWKLSNEMECIKDLKEKVNKIIEEETKTVIDTINSIHEQITAKTDQIKTYKERLFQEENHLNSLNKKLNQFKIEIGNLDGKASIYIGQIDQCNDAIIMEKNKVYPDKVAEISRKITTLQDQTKQLQDSLTEVEEGRNKLQEWQVRFKEFKSFMANSSLRVIEEMVNFFLQEMKTNLSVSIDGYRELSNGKLKEEISTLICRDGLNGESFSKFSGGERSKVDLAMILSLQKIINMTSEGGGLNLLFIDEILESLDYAALASVTKALSSLEQTIMMISHVEQSDENCHKLIVEKVNGISKIVN